jgi:archaellum biogenesis ATPase FlaH
VVNFLRVLSAKLKNANGILILAGAKGSIPEEVRSNLETTADGVIELAATSSGQTQIRTLRVKRLSGRKTSPGPVAFEIVTGKGILFRKLRVNIGIISNKRRPR